jgi:hypothetical protein
MKTILLATGYEVELEAGWEDHLGQSILGEMMLNPVNNKVYDFETALCLAQNEIFRISKTYNISYSDLLLGFFKKMIVVFQKAQESGLEGI